MGAKLYKDTCHKCGARRVDAQIGLEPTPEAYVTNIVAVMRECWRVMREDATLWLNLGDSYNSTDAGKNPGGFQGEAMRRNPNMDAAYTRHGSTQKGKIIGLKPKDLIGIPWRVAFALQQDGWYLRSDIIWHKPNPMPESVTDRPTKSHEYVFLLAKQERYYYDAEAIKEQDTTRPQHWISNGMDARNVPGQNPHSPGMAQRKERLLGQGRNRRTVWTIATSPYSGAHFATFPPALVEPMILAGTSPQACEHCGAAWERVIELGRVTSTGGGNGRGDSGACTVNNRGDFNIGKFEGHEHITTGWRPTCECPDNTGSGKCIVIDPFSGSGTVGRVCAKLGRSFVGGELNPAYIELAQHRTSGVQIAALL